MARKSKAKFFTISHPRDGGIQSGWLIAEWPQSAAVPKAKARRSKARKLGEKRVVGYF
jgi:hypothetical protein